MMVNNDSTKKCLPNSASHPLGGGQAELKERAKHSHDVDRNVNGVDRSLG